MEYHLEHGLRLLTEPEHKSLYSWAINELNAQGEPIGRDQIPWRWTLYFTATSCVVTDSVEISRPFQIDDAKPEPQEIEKKQVISITLRAGTARDDDNYFRRTTFSMFGTDRTIKDFYLQVLPLADDSKPEQCVAWGSVSYTSEIDFRQETVDDTLGFYFFVKPDTFSRYVALIGQGAVDEIILGVGAADGFYSGWSPSASTTDVKILTSADEQKIDLPLGFAGDPPRLGKVGDASLHLSRRLEFGKTSPEQLFTEEASDASTVPAETTAPTPNEMGRQILQLLISLKQTAWYALLLLVFIAVLIFLKR